MRTTAEIQAWRDEHPGERLDLYGADLQGADLQGANLRSANLRSANLQGADLGGADLQGAYLRGANLQGVTGKYWPPILDVRGYVSYVELRGGVLYWGSGCRLFTFEEALAHWGIQYDGERAIGDRYVRAIRDLATNTEFIQWRMKEQATQRALR